MKRTKSLGDTRPLFERSQGRTGSATLLQVRLRKLKGDGVQMDNREDVLAMILKMEVGVMNGDWSVWGIRLLSLKKDLESERSELPHWTSDSVAKPKRSYRCLLYNTTPKFRAKRRLHFEYTQNTSYFKPFFTFEKLHRGER